MRESLPAALEHIRAEEGGYVDHPDDPGGCTNMGITLATYRHHINPGAMCEELRAMRWEEAETIYRRSYWNAVHGDALPVGLDLVVLDMAVNAGPRRALMLLQRALGVAEDGIVGPVTCAAIERTHPEDLVNAYSAVRLDYYRSLKTWPTFGRGWRGRTRRARHRALGLIRAAEMREA